jgi:hypothetical protein
MAHRAHRWRTADNGVAPVAAYERTYGIPQPDAYTWALPGLPAHPRLVRALLGKATVHR